MASVPEDIYCRAVLTAISKIIKDHLVMVSRAKMLNKFRLAFINCVNLAKLIDSSRSSAELTTRHYSIYIGKSPWRNLSGATLWSAAEAGLTLVGLAYEIWHMPSSVLFPFFPFNYLCPMLQIRCYNQLFSVHGNDTCLPKLRCSRVPELIIKVQD